MTEAILFNVDDDQAVRLPKEFRMPGDRVQIRRSGDNVILEPLAEKPRHSAEEIRALLAEMHALVNGEVVERDQPPSQERDWSKLD
jgi:antitoxin VapB